MIHDLFGILYRQKDNSVLPWLHVEAHFYYNRGLLVFTLPIFFCSKNVLQKKKREYFHMWVIKSIYCNHKSL